MNPPKPKTTPSNQPQPTPVEDAQAVSLSLKAQSRVNVDLTLEPGSQVEVGVRKLGVDGTELEVIKTVYANPEQKKPIKRTFRLPTLSLPKKVNFVNPSWQVWLIVAALVIYLGTRFIKLDSYPIYFFTDEAVQTVLASDLVRDDFKSYTKEFLPTFLENGSQFNLGTSVYLQVVPFLIFGKSIWVTRGTSVLLTLLAALAVGLTANNIFKSRYAFAAILLLSITPAWFLHSRTAFETAIAVSFYAGFLYSYFKYQSGSPRYLFAAVLFGVLCFYSYSPAQLVMAVTALALLISDWRIHLKHWKVLLISAGIASVCAIPYIRFLILHPDENLHHLQVLNSYWIQNIPLTAKFGNYFKAYFQLLNPFYWFIPNTIDLDRHLMKGYGHLLIGTLPFFLLGLGVGIRKIKTPLHRALLLAMLAAPTGAALAGAGITRALFLVIPAVLLIFLGLDQVIKWLERWRAPQVVLLPTLFVGLAAYNIWMTRDALVNGPTWYENYGMAGQQYGAQQVFTEIKTMLADDPDLKIYLSPSWTNGTDVLSRYFFADPVPFQMGSIDSYLIEKREIDENQVFALMPEEMDRARESGKFTNITVIKTIPYPNGEPGFYFVKMSYAANIDDLLAADHAARQVLIEEQLVTSAGMTLTVSYPLLDMGSVQDLFDGNLATLARSFEANPMRLQLAFDAPKTISTVTVRIGGTATTIDLVVNPADGSPAVTLQKIVAEGNDFRDITFDLGSPINATSLSLSILNTYEHEPAHVHVWEVTLQ